MTELTRKRRNGNGHLSPFFRNDLFTNRFLMPRLFDTDDDLFDGLSAPPANIHETNKEFKVDLSVPGMKKEDFKIDVENGLLTISSEKEEEKKDNDKNYHRREFSYSSFSRSFSLPEGADESNISAKYDNGMLQLTIPKKETALKPAKKQITVS